MGKPVIALIVRQQKGKVIKKAAADELIVRVLAQGDRDGQAETLERGKLGFNSGQHGV